jgi:hypothetical protein
MDLDAIPGAFFFQRFEQARQFAQGPLFNGVPQLPQMFGFFFIVEYLLALKDKISHGKPEIFAQLFIF